MRLLHTFAVLGGDARQRYLAALLTASGFTVHTFAVPELQDTAASLEETVSQIDAVLSLIHILFRLGFPTPPVLNTLSLLVTITRRTVLQKVRHHPLTGCDCL